MSDFKRRFYCNITFKHAFESSQDCLAGLFQRFPMRQSIYIIKSGATHTWICKGRIYPAHNTEHYKNIIHWQDDHAQPFRRIMIYERWIRRRPGSLECVFEHDTYITEFQDGAEDAVGLAIRSVLGTPRGLSFALSLVGFLKKVRLFCLWPILNGYGCYESTYMMNNTIKTIP